MKINVIFDESIGVSQRASFYMKFSSVILLAIFYMNLVPMVPDFPESTRTAIIELLAKALAVDSPISTPEAPPVQITTNSITDVGPDVFGDTVSISDKIVLNRINRLTEEQKAEILDRLKIQQNK